MPSLAEIVINVKRRLDPFNKRRLDPFTRCRREHEAEYIVAASEVVFPEGSSGARYVAAYRKWLGLNPHPVEASAPPRRKREHKAKADDLDLSKSVDLVALSIKQRTARCRLLGGKPFCRNESLFSVIPRYTNHRHDGELPSC